MTDEEFVRARRPGCEIHSRQAGVYSEYAVRLPGWPYRYLARSWWPKDEPTAWFVAANIIREQDANRKPKP